MNNTKTLMESINCRGILYIRFFSDCMPLGIAEIIDLWILVLHSWKCKGQKDKVAEENRNFMITKQKGGGGYK